MAEKLNEQHVTPLAVKASEVLDQIAAGQRAILEAQRTSQKEAVIEFKLRSRMLAQTLEGLEGNVLQTQNRRLRKALRTLNIFFFVPELSVDLVMEAWMLPLGQRRSDPVAQKRSISLENSGIARRAISFLELGFPLHSHVKSARVEAGLE